MRSCTFTSYSYSQLKAVKTHTVQCTSVHVKIVHHGKLFFHKYWWTCSKLFTKTKIILKHQRFFCIFLCLLLLIPLSSSLIPHLSSLAPPPVHIRLRWEIYKNHISGFLLIICLPRFSGHHTRHFWKLLLIFCVNCFYGQIWSRSPPKSSPPLKNA